MNDRPKLYVPAPGEITEALYSLLSAQCKSFTGGQSSSLSAETVEALLSSICFSLICFASKYGQNALVEIPLEKAVRSLTLLGYERFDAVDGNGQFSLRGGILDFFMPDSDYPVRAEFWGDEITDLSYFDLETQRRFKKAGKIKLTPSTEIIIEDKDALADKIVF